MERRPVTARRAWVACRARSQRGAVLFVTLVVLVLMSYAAVSVVRSTDTGNLIAGNFAFRQATMQVSDRAISHATDFLRDVIVKGAVPNVSIPNRYAATRIPTVDSRGVPTTLVWGNVPCIPSTGVIDVTLPAVANCENLTGDYRLQYFIERQCNAIPNLTSAADVKTKCSYQIGTAKATTPAGVSIYYRVIIRARGPRGTEGLYEVMLSGPATS